MTLWQDLRYAARLLIRDRWFTALREGSRAFSGLTFFLGSQANVSDEGRPPEQFNGTYQSANMFTLIG